MESLLPAQAEAADMLSSLLAHLLDKILTRLDLRDAVGTSALSCAWRRRWESFPGLALCFPKGTRPSVITRVLLRYTGSSISRFSAYNLDVDDIVEVDEWLIALSRLSVESISIFKTPLSLLTLHSSIFSCDHLVCLDLGNCSIPPRPQSRFAGFPVLQELYLRRVDLAGNGQMELEAIIRGSPLLRVLVLELMLVHCMIEAPYLQTLVVESQDDDCWRFGKLPCLQYVSCCVERYGGGGHRLLEFLARVYQVRELFFYSPVTPNEVKIDRIPFTFHNLKSLEIVTSFESMESILLLFSLLRKSPNLEKLKIETDDWDDLCEEWTDEEWTDGMCASLQVVQINCCIESPPLSFMKLILSKANLLRTLSVDVFPDSQDDQLNELLKCRRASAQAQVLFKEDLPGVRFGVGYLDQQARPGREPKH